MKRRKLPAYLKELEAMQARGELRPGVHVVNVLHDPTCPVLTNSGPCNCRPEIRTSSFPRETE